MGNPFKRLRRLYRKKKTPAAKGSAHGQVTSGSASFSVPEAATAGPPAYSERLAPDAIQPSSPPLSGYEITTAARPASPDELPLVSIPPPKALLMSENEQAPDDQPEPPRPYADGYELWDSALEESGLEGLDMFQTVSDSNSGNRKGLAADIRQTISGAMGEERPESTARKIIENSVSVLTKFIAVGDVAASFDPVHTALPWAAVRFVLVLIIGNSELKAQLLAGIAAVAALLVQCDTHQQLYMAPDPTLRPSKTALEKLAASIVQAYAESQRFLSFAVQRQKGKFNADAVFKVGEARDHVNAILESEGRLQRSADYCERDCNLSSRADVRELAKLAADFPRTIQRQIESVLDQIDAREQLDILQWISSMPYGKHHNTVKEARTPGTCQWLLENKRFHEWKSTNTSTILWLQGSPGSGKTFITSCVIDHVQDMLQGSPDQEGFAYFYCNRNEKERRSPLSVLRSYVRQLSTAVASPGRMRKPLRDLCQKARLGGSSLVLGTCKDQLLESINLYSRTTLVLDALDECDPISRWELVRTIQGLVDESERPLKIFISSRPDYDIKECLSSRPNIEIQATDNQDDIEKFVNVELDKPRRWGPISSSLRKKVADTLCKRSQGMFQWAYLQIKQVLELPTEDDILDRLGSLPSGLRDAYGEIYGKISASKHSKLLVDRACMWVMAACKPLRSRQLLSAIRVNPDGETVDLKDEITEAALLDLCSHILVIDSERGVWKFSHLSVVEYFETNHWDPHQAEAYTSKVCLKLLIETEMDNIDNTKLVYHLLYPRHPFQIYLRRNWPYHVKIYDEQVTKEQRGADPTLAQLLKHFLGSPDKSSVKYRAWLKQNEPSDRYTPERPKAYTDYFLPEHASIFAMCRFSFYTLLRDWWDTAEITLSQKSESGRNLLEFAASSGCKPICEALLAREMPTNLQRYFKSDALVSAAHWGHMDIVQLLVKKGAETNLPHSIGTASALAAAVRSRDADIVNFLIENGADTNLTFGGDDGSALIVAAQLPRIDMAKLLIENGAEINLIPPTASSSSALRSAARRGSLEMVKYLVENGAEINLTPPAASSSSALASAAGRGFLEIVKYLVKNGAETNLLLPTGPYGSALDAAASQGNLEIAKLLIENGAEINLPLPTGLFGSALAKVAYFGGLEMVELLIDNGAEINLLLPTGVYGSALAAAASRGLLRILKCLIENGAETNLLLPTGSYGSALAAGANWGQRDCVQILLDAGAEVNLRLENGKYRTALQAALGHVSEGSRKWPMVHHPPIDNTLDARKREVAELLRRHGATDD